MTTALQSPPKTLPLPRGAEPGKHNRGHRIPLRGRYQTEVVFNGAHWRRSIQFSGDIYDIEAFGTAEIHPHGFPKKDDDTGKILDGPWEIQISASEIVDELCKDEVEGRYGLVHIPRDATDAEIARLKEQAKARWFEWFSGEAENGIADWESFVTRFREARPGDLPPQRPMRVNAFYGFRKLRRTEGLGRKQFVCNYCGCEFDVEADRKAHIEFDHPNAPEIRERQPQEPTEDAPGDQTLDQFLAAQDKDEAPKAKAAPKIPAPEVKELTDVEKSNRERGKAAFVAARRARLELSVADQKGLRFGDLEVIADVEQRTKKRAK